ncbi:restriction endonuclease subunit S [Filibacter tadaridae]|uniref:Type I restriction modification DNA specificity domain protein n=1 Tax=Filibacter tadaridae TaxID=2483811 RepID=A0A3P5X4M8_9BACL|nr:restriction endonuclease subunit S [Filibacter tadaridae]VDC26001.1 Type I restriction modification DNA specificity domain protein [Filibacter tadaridae]
MINKHVPEFRFPGFVGYWKQRKLEDLINTMHGGASITPNDYQEEGVPTVPKGAVNSSGIADISGSKFVSKDYFQKNMKASVYSGDLVTSLRDLVPTAPNMGRIVKLIGDSKEYLMPQGVYRLLIEDGVDENFLIAFSNSEKFRRIITQEKIGSTQVHIRNSEYLGIKLEAPSNEEQNKIGGFFKQLNETIALHQQELTTLQQTKQGFLQKMFPKEGESVPEVRFSGFTGGWGESKAIEIFKSVSDKNHPNLPVLSASQQKGMIYRSDLGIDIKYNTESTKNYKRVLPGQFVIHLRSFQGGFAFSNIEGITSPAYTVLDFQNREKHYPIFWRYVLASEVFIKRLEAVTYGIRDGRSISFSDFSSLKFRAPSYDEQIKIGYFLKQLDETIALHQQELDALQEIKKAFLQKMFV